MDFLKNKRPFRETMVELGLVDNQSEHIQLIKQSLSFETVNSKRRKYNGNALHCKCWLYAHV
jgi:hypothetical protein